jgi:hypothetical protein
MLDPYEFEPQPPCRFWSGSLALFVIGFFGVGLIYCAVARAAPIFKAEGANGTPAALRLTAAPCTDAKVLEALREKVSPLLAGKFRAAVLSWDGRIWASCWIDLGGVVYSIDEEGAPFQPIPLELFRDDSV